MAKHVIIVAGGTGNRMGAQLPKQFLPLMGRPLLWHTLQAFLSADPSLRFVIVLHPDFLEKGREIAEGFRGMNYQLVKGGATRFDSVKNGLSLVGDGIVAVHDAVRCLVTPGLIKRCFQEAEAFGSAVPVVGSTDSIRIALGAGRSRTEDRENVLIVQTPQTFRTGILKEAFKMNFSSSFTDEATVVEALGEPIHLVQGDHDNLKITRPIDLIVAENILRNR